MKTLTRTPTVHRILIALNLATESGRDIASGIFSYARSHCHWQIEILSLSEDATAGEEIIRRSDDGFDGVIYYPVGNVCPTVPGVAIGLPAHVPSRGQSLVRIDDEKLGAFAARHLLSLGSFASFAFVPDGTRAGYSLLRERGFRNELKRRGFGSKYTRLAPLDLVSKLDRLPKPTAILAAADAFAVSTLAACRRAQIAVPHQAVVLGIDDDRLLCDFSDPPLTSIRPDHQKVGWLAAEQLDRTLEGRKGTKQKTKVANFTVTERESTKPMPPVESVINRAMRFISYRLRQPITAEDVASHLGISRRLCDLRFVEQTGQTLSATILKLRLGEVARELRTTSMSIKAIAVASGFTNAKHLGNAFARLYGTSMTDYRKSR